MRTYISQFSYKGQDIEILYYKGKLSYVFELGTNRYGGAVKAEGKSIRDIMNAMGCLLIHYLESREALEKNDSK